MPIIENTDRFQIETRPEFDLIQIIDRRHDRDAQLHDVSMLAFMAAYAEMQENYGDPTSPWHSATWNTCLAHLADGVFAEANRDYAAWRSAAAAQGWRRVDQDPSEDRDVNGPCLHHAEQDRVMPIGEWEMAVRDLGYASPQEALDDLTPTP